MLIVVKTFDGHNINDGTNYKAAGVHLSKAPSAKPVFIEQSQADSVDSGAWTVEPRNVPIYIRVMDYGNRQALISQLKTWFKRGTKGDLVVTFTDEASDYSMECRVVSLTPDPDRPLVYMAMMQSTATAWRSVLEESATVWNVTGTGGTKAITVGGDDETRLIAELTPTAVPSGGYLYQQMYQLPNVSNVDFGFTPWCITINHQSLVSGAKSQSDGDDLRVHVNGMEVRRWLTGTNTTSCKIWFNLTLSAGYSLTINASIDNSSDIPYISLQNTGINNTALGKMPQSGILYHGTEWMSYSGVNASKRQITITKRGILGTTKQAHSAGDAFLYIQNVITLSYGNTGATNPATSDEHYDDTKPLFSLSSSDNSSWVYDTSSLYRDIDNTGRTGAWRTEEKRSGDVSKLYDITEDGSSGNPATGQKAGSYIKGSSYLSDTVNLRHTFYRACGINTVTATGKMYRNGNGFPTARVRKSKDGSTWIDVWTETKPANLITWTNWATHSSVSWGTGFKWIQQQFVGTISGVEKYAMNEGLTWTVNFTSANLPTGTLLGEVNNFTLDLTLSNNGNGDALSLVNTPILLNKLFLLDGEDYDVTFDGVNTHDSLRLNDESRSAWIRLEPGAQTLEISAASVGTLSVQLKWHKRRL